MLSEIQTRKAKLRANSYNPETRRFIAVAATETPVRMAGVEEVLACLEVAVDLGRMPVPLLRDHRRTLDDQLGTVLRAWFENGSMLVEVQLTERAAATYGRDLEAGHSFGVSVGYSTIQQSESGPRARRVTRWALHEVSLTPVGADPLAKTRALPETQTGDSSMETEVTTPEVPAKPTVAQTRAEIRTIIQRAGGTSEQADELIDANATTEQARAAAYELMTERSSNATRIRVGVSHEDPAAILQRQIGGLHARATGAKPADNEREFVGLSIPEHADLILQRNSIRTIGMSKEQRMTRALGTSDLPELLQGVGSRTLLAKYQVAQSPLVALAKKTTLTDFRENARLRVGEFGSLEKLGEHGEIKHTAREESKNKISLETFARRIDYTMKAMINDDLSALTDASEQFGIAAAARDADELIALLAANPAMDDTFALFSNQHNNTLASGEIDVETVSAVRLAMRKIKGIDGVTLLNVAPKYLVVSSELETIAEQFLAAYNAQAFTETNPFASKLTLVVEPRLPAFQWFVWADPALAPVLELAHLSGREGPQIESQQAWDTWGVSFRCIHHVGAAAIGWRGAFRIIDGEPEGEG